jgi:diguanylate cyclase (GGDEF)-like protein
MTQLYNQSASWKFTKSPGQRYKLPIYHHSGVDHFKSVNDFFGRQAGDHANACPPSQKLVRDSDQLARYGGNSPSSTDDDAPGSLAGRRKIEKVLNQKNCFPWTIYSVP